LSYLLDTNTCIRYLNGQSENVRARLERLTPDETVLCSVVKAELLYGGAKSTLGERSFARLNRFLSLFNSLAFDDRSAAVYGAIRADLERRGTPIGPYDLMIAAIALASDSILVTHNSRELEESATSSTKIGSKALQSASLTCFTLVIWTGRSVGRWSLIWWRRRESNPRPKKPAVQSLRVYPVLLFQRLSIKPARAKAA